MDEGERTRREVLGDEHVDRALAGASEYARPFQDYLTDVAWGKVWARPGLDRRTRSCLTIALLTALRRGERAADAPAARRSATASRRRRSAR